MPRRKAAPNVKISRWLSANHDNREGRFIQVGNSFMLSPKVHELTHGAQWLYFCMLMESGGNQEVVFPRSAAKKYRIASTSFERNVHELETHGFVERVQPPGQERWVKSRFRFCIKWKQADATTLPLRSGLLASAPAPTLSRTGKTN